MALEGATRGSSNLAPDLEHPLSTITEVDVACFLELLFIEVSKMVNWIPRGWFKAVNVSVCLA